MKSVLSILFSLVFMLILCASSLAAYTSNAKIHPSDRFVTSLELSHDQGVQTGYTMLIGAGTYAAVQYDSPGGGPWYLSGIKYYVWGQGWPDSIFQGYGVGCWKFEGGLPGALAWPTDGELIYNPNTGGYWIVQPVEPNLNLLQSCPTGFLVGIEFRYNYPTNDAISIDNTTDNPQYDWWHYTSTGWEPAVYGNHVIHALINDIGNPGVETVTLGGIRALYR